jgi:hypothetical protein
MWFLNEFSSLAEVSLYTFGQLWCLCKGVQLKNKLQHAGTRYAEAWPPCHLCYRPTIFFIKTLSRCALSLQGKIQRFSKILVTLFFYFKISLVWTLRSVCSFIKTFWGNSLAATSGVGSLFEGARTALRRKIGIPTSIDTASHKNGARGLAAAKTSELSEPLCLFGITTPAKSGFHQPKSRWDPGNLTTQVRPCIIAGEVQPPGRPHNS